MSVLRPPSGKELDGVKTTCAYCGVGCGIVANQTGARSATIKGDPDHPANFGRLCSKGTHLGETIGLEGRLLYPEIKGERVAWDSALQTVADQFMATIAEYGPDAVAFYVSGQLLTEDYYVANKLMKGFIGSANIDTNSRLCMASAVAAHNRAFGEDIVPCSYSDLEAADLIVLVGSNTAWCHPVIWQRIEAARQARGTKLVVIDPRCTETAERADLHLAIAPDSDVALFCGLLHEMKAQYDAGYLAQHLDVPEGFWDGPPLDVAKLCDIPPAQLKQFYDLFAAHPRTVTLFSQGVNQSVQGTDKGNAIINLHLATGRIGKSGAGPFSITGQPNAMGGREVGGLASTLACHRGFSDAERDWAQRFWQSPTICPGPGLKAVDMFEAIHDGRIKAVWIMATNPAVSMPQASRVREALAKCPLVVVSDCIAETDTSAFAHVKLPALGWGEKDGTVTNSERVVSRQRGFLSAPGEARPDWWIVAEMAKHMGWQAEFDYPTQASVFREYAAMTGFENNGARLLDISDKAKLTDSAYDSLEPFQWGGVSPFASARFPTASGKAALIAVQHIPRSDSRDDFPLECDDKKWEPVFVKKSHDNKELERTFDSIKSHHALSLNTGRYRDQWHTMTRTGLSPKLSQHRREPLVEVHPDTIARYGLADGTLAIVKTDQGKAIYRVASTPGQRRNDLFVPMHWTDQTSGGGRTGLLPSQARDPLSGQPGFKNTPATIQPWQPRWNAFLITRHSPTKPTCAYWASIRTAHGWLIEMAGDGDPAELLAMLPAGERAEVSDAKRGTIRAAVLDAGQLQAALFVTRDSSLPARDWLMDQLGGEEALVVELLAGRPASPQPDRGPIVCVCFDIGMKTILDTIRSAALTTVEAVGAALAAGTNCGSCRPAIARLIETEKTPVDA